MNTSVNAIIRWFIGWNFPKLITNYLVKLNIRVHVAIRETPRKEFNVLPVITKALREIQLYFS